MRKITSGPQFFAYLQGQKEGLSAEQFKALDPRNQVRILVNNERNPVAPMMEELRVNYQEGMRKRKPSQP